MKRDEKSVRWKSKVCRRAVVDHTFFCTAEQDELKTLLRNFALYTAVNLKAEVHTVELLRINLDEMWSDKFPIGMPAKVECCFVLVVVLHIDSKQMRMANYSPVFDGYLVSTSWSCAGSNPGCAE